MARSYADFVASATVIESTLDDPQIDVSADVAAVSAWHAGRWLVVWRRLQSRVVDPAAAA